MWEGVQSDDNNEGVTRTKSDGRQEEREGFDVEIVPARRKKRRAPSVEAEPFVATKEETSPQEKPGSDQNCTEEHPLQVRVTALAVRWVLVACTSKASTWKPKPKPCRLCYYLVEFFLPNKLPPYSPRRCLPRHRCRVSLVLFLARPGVPWKE